MIQEFRADLHCHSTCSDGTLSPEEIIDLAKEIGLSGLSITDHDTLMAYDTAIEYAKSRNLEMIPGVEFSSSLHGVNVHILGFAFSLDNEAIHNFCQKHHERRNKRYPAILTLLAENEMPISEEDLPTTSHHGNIGRPHIAQAMIEKGYVTSFNEAFKKFLGENKPCFVKSEAFSVEETIDVIHEAGGVAIIAHPHLIRNASTVRQLLNMPFDGLEGYYARFGPRENNRWLEIAKNKRWLITGGSDFHGAVKSHINLGCSWVNEDLFRTLQTSDK
ncbi:MAG: 5'-3' exoribonuclease [Chlamydiae bacterium]|nr:5'-3' exoribonuclease [Chlamydiota bacterium]